MLREISAGGVLIRPAGGGWEVAVIEPQKEAPTGKTGTSIGKTSQKLLLALPKGLVDPGEKPEATAIREVREETGISGTILTKLGDIKYVYVRSWGDKQQVFKIVSFYLLKYESGEIDNIAEDMRIEVQQARWIPLEGADKKLAYRGEKEMVRKAQEYLRTQLEA